MNNDLISREALLHEISKLSLVWEYGLGVKDCLDLIDNAPTVNVKDQIAGAYNEGYMCGNKEAEKARPQGECKTCKYYHPFCEQFTNKPRGDGYCVIARMTAEGMTTINCKDEFGCSDYQKGGAE